MEYPNMCSPADTNNHVICSSVLYELRKTQRGYSYIRPFTLCSTSVCWWKQSIFYGERKDRLYGFFENADESNRQDCFK